jgi:hypothetical protein
MIETYNRKKHLINLVEFLKETDTSDFYITENNFRIYISNIKSLDYFIKKNTVIYVKEIDGNIVGIVTLWKSIGNDINRYFVKLSAKDEDTASSLLMMLLWNVDNKTLFVKIKKDSKFLPVFRDKGFDFAGDRGREILLRRRIIKGDN